METGDAVTQAVNAIGLAALAFSDQLATMAMGIANSGSVIAVIMLAFAMVRGFDTIITPLVRTIFLITLFGYAIGWWPTLLTTTLSSADQIIAMAVPGWEGPTSAFGLASGVSQRLMAAWPELDWPGAMMRNAVQLGFTGIAISICLYLLSIAVLCTKVLFVVAGSLGPLLLGFGMIPGFAHLGMGPLNFLLRGMLTYIGTAIIAAFMVASITSLVGVAGLDAPLTTDSIQGLFALSLLGCVLTLASGTIGGMLMSHSFSGGGVSSVLSTSSTVVGAGSSAISGASSAAGAAKVAATTTGNIGRSAAGAVTRSSAIGGSAFG